VQERKHLASYLKFIINIFKVIPLYTKEKGEPEGSPHYQLLQLMNNKLVRAVASFSGVRVGVPSV
jgi:hypothetical protein